MLQVKTFRPILKSCHTQHNLRNVENFFEHSNIHQENRIASVIPMNCTCIEANKVQYSVISSSKQLKTIWTSVVDAKEFSGGTVQHFST